MAFRWPWQQRSALLSISDPATAELLGVGSPNYAGVTVGEGSALGLSAVYRSVNLIAGTLASLSLPTIREVDGVRTPVSSFLDTPGGPDGPTPFEWKETVFAHLLLHGNAFLQHVYNGGGALVALAAVHPLCVQVELDLDRPGGKVFRTTGADGRRIDFDLRTMTHIPALCIDGLRGLSPISVARNSLGTAVAADRAAARMFSSGALISGMVTPTEDLTEEEATAIKAGLQRGVAGWDNAGEIAVINRKLQFTPWTMNAKDAQFLESRVFQVEEVARWYGIPPHLLGQTEKVTSWGAGIEVQNRGLARNVLQPWARRVEQRLSLLLPQPRYVEFDFSDLEKPNPETELSLLLQQVAAGILTVDEARHRLNLPPLPTAGGPAVAPTEVPA